MKKILLITLMLLILYSLIITPISRLIGPRWLESGSYFQSNVIVAQEYIYDKRGAEVVIVGSSLSACLNPRRLPDNCWNLSLIGLGVHDGLEIIKRCGAKPKLILIETNWADRAPSPCFTDIVFKPGLYQLRKYLPALREENQPFYAVIQPIASSSIRFIKRCFARLPIPPGASSNPQVPASHEAPRKAQAVFEQNLRLNLAIDNRITDPEWFHTMAAETKKYVEYFERENTTVVFFEIPEDKAFYNSYRLRSVRHALSQTFPESRYVRLPSLPWETLTTSDGMHLTGESVNRYTVFFVNMLKELRPHQQPILNR